MEARILAIVVTFNGEEWIERSLESLTHSTVVPEVLVVDNGSTDDTVKMIRQKYPDVELVAAGKNLGFGKANNIGLRRVLSAGFEYAFLLNQDAWVRPDVIHELVEISRGYGSFGILSPVHLSGDGTRLDYKFAEYMSREACRDFCSDMFLGTLGDVYDVDFVNAASWLISRECVQRVGGFSSLFFHYGEDVDYVKRARFRGFRIGVVPSAIAYHDRKLASVETSPLFDSYYIPYLAKLVDPNRPRSRARILASLGGRACLSILNGQTGIAKKQFSAFLALLKYLFGQRPGEYL